MLAYKYQGGNTVYYIFKHFIFIVVGFFVMYFTSRLSYKFYFKLARPLLWVSLGLLFLTLFESSTNDAKRWFTIPLTGISFQTSDLAKVSLMLYLAKVLSVSQDSEEQLFAGFKKCLIAIVGVCGLILLGNFSTAFLVGFTSLFVLFIARVKIKWIFAGIGICIGAGILLILFASLLGFHSRVDTWKSRVETFMSSDSESSRESNYQAEQSKIAVARGGLTGVGPGGSVQRNSLPHPYSDFIFSIICEEYGLIGGLGVMIFYLIFFYRCLYTIRNSERAFPMFLSLGLSLNIIFQALANMLVAVNITPVTGQPLPFVSMGGTSIIFTSISVGIILNISRYAGKKELVEEIEEEQNVEEITDYPFIAG
jgi:cell division protein FtsW